MEIIITTGRTMPEANSHLLGIHSIFHNIGVAGFVVLLVDGENEDIVWDGQRYEEAIFEAEDMARGYSCRVIDVVVR